MNGDVGVAVFSGFILYDTQKILKHARLAQMGAMVRDPIRESVSLIIDAINLCTSPSSLLNANGAVLMLWWDSCEDCAGFDVAAEEEVRQQLEGRKERSELL